MSLPLGASGCFTEGSAPTQASLDRIDSTKGYVIGNVEFVCLSANYAKNGFTKNQMLEFFKPPTV